MLYYAWKLFDSKRTRDRKVRRRSLTGAKPNKEKNNGSSRLKSFWSGVDVIVDTMGPAVMALIASVD